MLLLLLHAASRQLLLFVAWHAAAAAAAFAAAAACNAASAVCTASAATPCSYNAAALKAWYVAQDIDVHIVRDTLYMRCCKQGQDRPAATVCWKQDKLDNRNWWLLLVGCMMISLYAKVDFVLACFQLVYVSHNM